jgi:hypothetical protein
MRLGLARIPRTGKHLPSQEVVHHPIGVSLSSATDDGDAATVG